MTLTAISPSDQRAAAVDGVTILLYCANAQRRAQIRQAVGDVIGSDAEPVNWIELATPAMAPVAIVSGPVDLAILDAETPKLGGIGLAKQWREELHWCPPLLLLVARTQDAWLASWSGVDRTLTWPADPFALRQIVTELING